MVDGKTSVDLVAERADETKAQYLARMARLAALSDYALRVIADVGRPNAYVVHGATPTAWADEMRRMWERQMVGHVQLAGRAANAFLDELDYLQYWGF